MPEVLDQPTQAPSAREKYPNLRPKQPGTQRRSKIQELRTIQDVLLKHIEAEGTRPADAASCARAFDVIDDRLRIVRGQFKAGDIRAADLDPVKAAWVAKRFRQANKGRIMDLPRIEQAMIDDAKPAKVVKVEPAAPAKVEPIDSGGWPTEGC